MTIGVMLMSTQTTHDRVLNRLFVSPQRKMTAKEKAEAESECSVLREMRRVTNHMSFWLPWKHACTDTIRRLCMD